MTYEDLLALARAREHQLLETVSGTRFRVGIYRDCPFFIPESSGRGRSDGPKAAHAFVERFNATGSLRPVDYADVTRNASYFIGLVCSGQKKGPFGV